MLFHLNCFSKNIDLNQNYELGMKKKYEYRIEEMVLSKWNVFSIEDNESLLIGLGLDGWRLSQISSTGGKFCYIFEREIDL